MPTVAKKSKSVSFKKKSTVLIVMDGWGIAKEDPKSNPINPEHTPFFYDCLKKYPHTELKASGVDVGLFKNQEGNSEAGHTNLGAGRVVKQDALYISDAIADGTFFKNPAFHQALHHVKKYKTAVHLFGLLSNHNSAHSCPEHIYALLDFFYKEKIRKVYLHLFTDGRDSGQHDALKHLEKLKSHFHGTEKVISIMGRFYGMDRGKNWSRIKKAYEAIVLGQASYYASSSEEAIAQAYNRNETDEFISPTRIINGGKKKPLNIADNDAMFFFNLRSDRARELTKVFVQKDFEAMNPGSFKRKKMPKNTRFVAMTDFGPDLPGVLTAYPSRDVQNSLVQVLCPKRQLFISETEKFAHVTYFFNGGYTKHFCEERRVKIESKNIRNYATDPKMKAGQLATYVCRAIISGEYDFILLNFPNPDMVGHTGNFSAATLAIKEVDTDVEKIVKTLEKCGGQGIITADHGNVEEMINKKTKEIDTEHTTNPVPCILVGKKFKGKKIKMKKGRLADVAPTILKMMDMKKPKEMTGRPLF